MATARLKELVLLIDDEPGVRDTLGFLLEAEGFPTVLAGDGVQGLEAARLARPTMIIVDVTMPRMDGHQFCREIRADHVLKDAFIVCITGTDEIDARLESLDAGADAYLAKPVDHDRLLELVVRRFAKSRVKI